VSNFFVFSAQQDESLKGLHRLLSRCVQAFVLIDLLRTVEREQEGQLKHYFVFLLSSIFLVLSSLFSSYSSPPIRSVGHSVPWEMLGKISFRSLVSSQGVHDKVKGLLARVLDKGIRGVERGGEGTADFLADQLSRNCYLVLLVVIMSSINPYLSYFTFSFSSLYSTFPGLYTTFLIIPSTHNPNLHS
jgi:hypothetical protein